MLNHTFLNKRSESFNPVYVHLSMFELITMVDVEMLVSAEHERIVSLLLVCVNDGASPSYPEQTPHPATQESLSRRVAGECGAGCPRPGRVPAAVHPLFLSETDVSPYDRSSRNHGGCLAILAAHHCERANSISGTDPHPAAREAPSRGVAGECGAGCSLLGRVPAAVHPPFCRKPTFPLLIDRRETTGAAPQSRQFTMVKGKEDYSSFP